jgi:murein L,D-transpeptidase YcbB/YkuD
MPKWLLLLSALTVGVIVAGAAPPARKSPPAPKGPAAVARGSHRPAQSARANASRSAASRGRSRGRGVRPVVTQRRRYGQPQPTEDRYLEIQQALASRGYLQREPTGDWKPDCEEALKRFQKDQNLPPNGRITSLSLIALGLGPKRDSSPVTAAAEPTP